MVFGAGWELEENDRYRISYEEHIAGNESLEDLIEILYWALLRNPLDPMLLTKRVAGTFWFAKVPGPPAFLVFYELDQTERTVRLDFLTPDIE